MRQYQYPFSAIVEQKALKTALLLNAVDPSIGGVLIQGHKGTGKSTAARALAQLLPDIKVMEESPFNSAPEDALQFEELESKGNGETAWRPMPFVELPLNATEDRLVGSLHIERALKTGERRFEPGLLAAANRGILYVDEVNLLPDHLVDMLLDSAASGVNVIEREGISFSHPARFILIGTMNPEEGDLRPQFLDRFGLCVAIRSVTDIDSRKAIVQRHMAFEGNPPLFLEQWAPADQLISDQIVYARDRLIATKIPDSLVTAIVRVTRELHLQGHRADITVLKAARAHAALMEKCEIDKSDIFEAAQLAIPHRLKSSPLDRHEVLQEKINDALVLALGLESGATGIYRAPSDASLEEMIENMQVPGSAAAGSILFSFLGNKRAEIVFEPDRTMATTGIDIGELVPKKAPARKKSKKAIAGTTGRYLRDEQIRRDEREYRIAINATLRQAALRSAKEGAASTTSPAALEEDFRKKKLFSPLKDLIVFVVDTSGSMGSGERIPMKAAKGAALAILRKAHPNRGEVAIVAFGGKNAAVVLPPTTSVTIAEAALEQLPAGGATPFAESLLQAWQLVRSERLKNPDVRPVLVIVSDGEANVPLTKGAEPMEELESLAKRIALDRIPALFIDAASPKTGEGGMQKIAEAMQASFVKASELSAAFLFQKVVNLERDA